MKTTNIKKKNRKKNKKKNKLIYICENVRKHSNAPFLIYHICMYDENINISFRNEFITYS